MVFVKEFMSEQDISRYKGVHGLRPQWVIDRKLGIFLRLHFSDSRPDMGSPTEEWHFSYQERQLFLDVARIPSRFINNEPYITQRVKRICYWENKQEIALGEALAFVDLSKRAFAKMLQDTYGYYMNYGYLHPTEKERDCGYIFIFNGKE